MKPYIALFSFAFITLLSGCREKATAPATTPRASRETPRAEVRLGDNESRDLPFTITAIYEKQKPAKVAPFHVQGGDWTFLDCQAKANSQVVFTIGVKAKSGQGRQPVAWGQAVISVDNREAGGRFVDLFARVFQGKTPKPATQPGALKPLSVNTAILGQNQKRNEGGGFSDEGGGWTATKWFLETDGHYGEVFFNYNLERRQGEFSEKDEEYADDLVAILASALRDGLLSGHTSENSPSVKHSEEQKGKERGYSDNHHANSVPKEWLLSNQTTNPAKITVLTGTKFLCGNVRCRLLGVRESNDPAVRQLAEKFSRAWFGSVGNYIGIYNDSNPLLDSDGTAVVWIRGYDCFLSCLNEELVRAGLVEPDNLPTNYVFTEPRKSGDEVEDWQGVLSKAKRGYQKGEELRVLFKWPTHHEKSDTKK
jgi:hypothetical protein